jgi:hypothetical protein
MELLWRDAAEQNGADPSNPAALVLLGSGPLRPGADGSPPVHGMGAHTAAVHQAYGWMCSADGADAAAAAAEQEEQQHDGVAVSMVLLRLATFETDMLITYNLPAPRPPPTAAEAADPWRQPAPDAAVRTHYDVLSVYYATHDPSKTSEQIATILAKRTNDRSASASPACCSASCRLSPAPVDTVICLWFPSYSPFCVVSGQVTSAGPYWLPPLLPLPPRLLAGCCCC